MNISACDQCGRKFLRDLLVEIAAPDDPTARIFVCPLCDDDAAYLDPTPAQTTEATR